MLLVLAIKCIISHNLSGQSGLVSEDGQHPPWLRAKCARYYIKSSYFMDNEVANDEIVEWWTGDKSVGGQ